MLLGLGHVKIIETCEKYIVRGYIRQDEYDSLYNYLYLPYKELGGNGTAERMVNEVKKLPIRKEWYSWLARRKGVITMACKKKGGKKKGTNKKGGC